MIFLTLGTHQPFDRMVRVVDKWCAQNPDAGLFGQLPGFEKGGHRPTNFEWVTRLHPAEYSRLIRQSRFVVAHAGMGSIISALCLSTPIIVFPRRAAFGEGRNDHQLATIERFRTYPGVTATESEEELVAALDARHAAASADRMPRLGPFAQPRLTHALREAIIDRAPAMPEPGATVLRAAGVARRDRGLSEG